MITIKSKRELQGMQKSGRVLAAMFEGLRDVIKPGISTWEIEEFAQDFMKKHGGRLSEQGFEGYKYGTCISVNDQIATTIPKEINPLECFFNKALTIGIIKLET